MTGFAVRDAIDAIHPGLVISDSNRLQELPSPVQFRFVSSDGGDITWTVRSIARLSTGPITSGTQSRFFFGGSAANDFLFVNADIIDSNAGSITTTGAPTSLLVGGGNTQTIGELQISAATGNWATYGSVNLCDNNSGGNVNIGGNTMTGGDVIFNHEGQFGPFTLLITLILVS